MRGLWVFAATIALAALAPVAHAQGPSREQSAALQSLFGFDAALPYMLADAIGKRGDANWTTAQRDCVAAEVKPVLQEALDGAFAELFQSDENAVAWLDFAQTASGRKMMASVRDTVAAGVAKKTGGRDAAEAPSAPVPEFTAEESMEVLAFLTSPAGGVLQRDFPEPEVDPERVKALQPRIESTCGVAFDR